MIPFHQSRPPYTGFLTSVAFKVDFKVSLTYKALRSLPPSYLFDFLLSYPHPEISRCTTSCPSELLSYSQENVMFGLKIPNWVRVRVRGWASGFGGCISNNVSIKTSQFSWHYPLWKNSIRLLQNTLNCYWKQWQGVTT